MPAVLTMDSTVLCGPVMPALHGGTIAVASSKKLTVNGAAVLVKASVMGKTVNGCQTPPSQTTAPCTSVASVSSLESLKLTAGGEPVLIGLTGATLVTKGTPGPLFASAVQTKLTAL